MGCSGVAQEWMIQLEGKICTMFCSLNRILPDGEQQVCVCVSVCVCVCLCLCVCVCVLR